MNDTERFPKPDVPWLHEIEPGLRWPGPIGWDDTVVSTNGRWTVTVVRRPAGRPCGARHTRQSQTRETPPGGYHCALPEGHESPHVSAVRADIGVSSLRRVAQPAGVSS